MNIQPINRLYFGNSINDENAFQYVFCPDINKPEKGDFYAMSKVSKRAISDEERCYRLIKHAQINDIARFSPKEKDLLIKEIKRFNTKYPKAPLLKELLAMKYSNGKFLSHADVASYFSLMGESTSFQQRGVINLMKYYTENGIANNSDDLNNLLLLPLENKSVAKTIIGRLEYKYSYLPAPEKNKSVAELFDVFRQGKFRHYEFLGEIFEKIKNDKTGLMLPLIKESTKKCTTKEFKKLLEKITSEKINNMKKIHTNPDDEAQTLFVNLFFKKSN